VRTTTETLLSLDPGLADRTFGSTTSRWANVTTNTNLGVNDYPARSGVNGLLRWIRGQSASVTVYHRSAAQGGTEIARATGGPVFGPGSETSDSILARLSHNEHVWSAAEVRGAGGHAVMEQMRAWARAGVRGFAEGGTPAYQYRPSFSAPTPAPSGGSGPVTAVLAAEDRALLQAVATRPVQVQMGRRTLAEVTSVAGEYGRARGQGGHR